MSKLKKKLSGLCALNALAVAAALSLAPLLFGAAPARAFERFERTYTTQGKPHLTLSNINGTITVKSWDKRSINVRATIPPASIEDHSKGSDINLLVKRLPPPGRADFQILVPAETSVSLTNVMGKIEVQGVTGHVSVSSIDGDVRLLEVRPTSIDVKVTTGDIFFDGELHEGGSYALQSMKGDIDVTLPAGADFNLNARSLSGVINLGDFLNSLTGASRSLKSITGTYLRGGPRLTLTTYNGRILLHKK